MENLQALAGPYANHLAHAQEVWQTLYRVSDMLFHIIEDRVVMTDLKGGFASAWQATAEQMAQYRTGNCLK